MECKFFLIVFPSTSPMDISVFHYANTIEISRFGNVIFVTFVKVKANDAFVINLYFQDIHEDIGWISEWHLFEIIVANERTGLRHHFMCNCWVIYGGDPKRLHSELDNTGKSYNL